MKEQLYALIEADSIHTPDLTLPDAEEMLERHARIFDRIEWRIAPMEECENMERLIGYLERFRDNAVRYHS